MTKSQRIHLFADLWPAACRAQHWSETDRERRLDQFARALQHLPKYRAMLATGREISTGDIDTSDGFTAVKNHLLMLAGNVAGAVKEGDPLTDVREKAVFKVEEVIKCLAIYPRQGEEAPMGLPGAEAYANALANDLAWRGRALGAQVRDWRELSAEPDIKIRGGEPLEGPSQLARLLMNLSQRLNGKGGFRVRAGHTLHEMKLTAGVKCSCARICAKRRPVKVRLPVAAPVVQEEEIPAENCPF